MIFDYFSKICREYSSSIKNGEQHHHHHQQQKQNQQQQQQQQQRVLYMKTNIHFLSYLAHFFLEREMFRRKFVEKNKTRVL